MKRFVKLIALLMGMVMVFNLCGCQKNSSQAPVSVSSKKYNIAVISAESGSGEFEMFCSGVTTEFNNIGYNVDKFAAQKDKDYLETVLEESLKGGYVGVILYDLNDYAEDFAKKAKEAGVSCVAFAKSDYTSDLMPVVRCNQAEMTRLSIDELTKVSNLPISDGIVKVWSNKDSAVNMARSNEFDRYTVSKGIKTAANLYEEGFSVKSGLSRTTKTALNNLPQTGFNYIWAVDDDMAAAVSEYLSKESINNAAVSCVGITQKNILKMYKYELYWRAASAVSYSASGRECAKNLSSRIENKETESVFDVAAVVLHSSSLNENSTIEIVEKSNETEN